MRLPFYKTIILLFISCSTVVGQEVLNGFIVNEPQRLTFSQIVDTLNVRYHLQFSNDASLVADTLKKYDVAASLTSYQWLNQSFSTDSSEWILVEDQIIIRRKRMAVGQKPRLIFRGVILSESKNEPIPFATVCVMGTNMGTITNSNGEFEFRLTADSSACTLEASSLGFMPTRLQMQHSNQLLTIKLQERVTELPEVLVTFTDPLKILAKVVANRDLNYASSPTLLTGFFRESILKKDRYVDVTEAVVAVCKPSYVNEFASEKVLVEKVRRYKDSLSLGNISLRLEGGPFYFSKLDVARYFDFLPRPNTPSMYKYHFNGYDSEYGKDVYVIDFEPVIDDGELLYTGTFYIDRESYAITCVNFQLSANSIKKSKSYFVQSEKGGTKTVPLSAKYQVHYRPSAGRWMLSYVKGELALKIQNKSHKLHSTNFTAITELAITESATGKYQILNNGYVKSHDILSEKVSLNSPLYWQDFNVIPPLQEVRLLFESE